MRDGNLTAPPVGWLDFCQRNPADPYCRPPDLTDARRRELHEVQRQMRALALKDDQALFQQAEYWTPARPEGGDCEDHALAARAKLLAAGWPPRALRLAMAWTEQDDYHSVLTVDVVRAGRTATLVLDRRFADVRDWSALTRLGYRWDRRQAAGRPYWVTVAPPAGDDALGPRRSVRARG